MSSEIFEIESDRMKQTPLLIRLIDRASDMAGIGAALAVILLVLNVFVDVIGRTFFNTPFGGTLEMTANWWMPALALLAFAFTERHQEHIKVTILLDVLPLRMRQIVEGVFGLIAAALLLALAYYTLQDALKSANISQTTAGTPPVSIWPSKFIGTLGVFLLALQAAATSYRYFARRLPQPHDYQSEADLG